MSMMIKRRILTFSICSMVFISGCANSSGLYNVREEAEKNMDDIEGDETMVDVTMDGYYEMTDEEKELLGKASPDPDRVYDGKLWSYQVYWLNQLRAGTKYLKEKYPNHTFKVLSFAPANEFNQYADFTFQEELIEKSGVYRVRITSYAGGYECADDYYAVSLRSDYDKMLEELMENHDIQVRSYTYLQALLGIEIDEDITPEKFLKKAPKATKQTYFFVETSMDNEEIADKIESVILNEGIYGNYDVCFVSAGDIKRNMDDLAGGKLNQDGWEFISFNCFDAKD